MHLFKHVLGVSDLIHLRPSAAYIRQWIVSASVQIMPCRLFSAKPVSKPMLGYWTNFGEIWIKKQNFPLRKIQLNISSAKWRPFCPGGWVYIRVTLVWVKPCVYDYTNNKFQTNRSSGHQQPQLWLQRRGFAKVQLLVMRWHNWGLCCQKQVSQAGTSNYIPQ